jgi:quercetin dioxygenase-like cupin family protein
MSMYSEPPTASPAHRPTISDVVRDDVGNRSFTITFAPGDQLPVHRNASRILIEVVEGDGVVGVDGGGPSGVVAGDQVQVAPHAPHDVAAGTRGLVLRVHLVSDCCTAC